MQIGIVLYSTDKFGDITGERVDAIVNAANRSVSRSSSSTVCTPTRRRRSAVASATR